jgi:uncharacterized membrane protein YqjE
VGVISEKAEPERGIVPLLKRMVEEIGHLVAEHIELVRLELTQDANTVRSQVLRMAVFLPFAVVGYAFVCAALAIALTNWLSLAWAMFVVGAANLVLGSVGFYFALLRMKSQQVLRTAMKELTKSVEVLTPVIEGQATEASSGK